jgi:predicted GIY-YIG superfamily endonuclease
MARVSGQGPPGQVATLPGAAGVYLLHADRSHPVYGWQHYIGWSRNIDQRLADHRRGSGSRVTREWRRAGIAFRVVGTWPGVSQGAERRLQQVKGRNLCPVCSGAAAGREAQEAAAVSPFLFSLRSSASAPGGVA